MPEEPKGINGKGDTTVLVGHETLTSELAPKMLGRLDSIKLSRMRSPRWTYGSMLTASRRGNLRRSGLQPIPCRRADGYKRQSHLETIRSLVSVIPENFLNR